MNLNQKKQLATILTTVASIIFTGTISSIFSGKMTVDDFRPLLVSMLVYFLYYSSIRILKKEKVNNDRTIITKRS